MFNRLRGRIIECYGRLYAFESAMGMSRGRLSKLLNSFADWTREEIVLAAEKLNISQSEIGYFFFPEVSKVNLDEH